MTDYIRVTDLYLIERWLWYLEYPTGQRVRKSIYQFTDS